MGNTFYFDWEVGLMQWIQSWLGPVGTVIASVFSEMGEQLVCVAVLGFLYWCWEKEYGQVCRTERAGGYHPQPHDQEHLRQTQTVL